MISWWIKRMHYFLFLFCLPLYLSFFFLVLFLSILVLLFACHSLSVLLSLFWHRDGIQVWFLQCSSLCPPFKRRKERDIEWRWWQGHQASKTERKKRRERRTTGNEGLSNKIKGSQMSWCISLRVMMSNLTTYYSQSLVREKWGKWTSKPEKERETQRNVCWK